MRARIKHIWSLATGVTFVLLLLVAQHHRTETSLWGQVTASLRLLLPQVDSLEPIDLETILAGRLLAKANQTAYKWTDHDGSEAPYEQVGVFPGHILEFDNRDIVDARTQEPHHAHQDGHPFNLAVLRLPIGSQWQFVGVSRGPTVYHDAVWVSGQMSREQTMIAYGLNITADGKLFTVTAGNRLDLPMEPSPGCIAVSHFAWTHGAEDPRLFWTDAGTPGMTYTRTSSYGTVCRDIGFIPDLRAAFADLDRAIAREVGVQPFGSVARAPGQTYDWELMRESDQPPLQKNWAPFYPGSAPNRSAVHPYIHFSFAPDVSMEPIEVTPRFIRYRDIVTANSSAIDCVHRAHAGFQAHRLHGATPLHRLTLCERGCRATSQNTVFATFGHLHASPRYAKFMAIYNTTYPFEPLSVGPIIHLDGFDDVRFISYAAAITPLPRSYLNATYTLAEAPQPYLPDHFFLDDLVIMSLGVRDWEMANIVLSFEELLGRHQMCSWQPPSIA